MDWKPFVCRVSCSKIKQKTCFLNRRGSNILEPRLQYNGARAPIYRSPSNKLVGLKYVLAITQMRFNKTQSIWIGLIQLRKGFSMSHKIIFQIFNGLQYIGARAPLYWSPLTTIFRNIILWLIENHFLSWINPIQMDWVLLNLIGVIAKKYFWFASLLCKKNIWWAPIYWSMGSIILEPRLQFIGAPSVQQTCFLFYFWTWNTANKMFPVH